MTTLDIDAIENAGRTATVWIPDSADRRDSRPVYAAIASALGILFVAGVLIAFIL